MTGAWAPIEREGARVLLLDDFGRLLVIKGHDPHEPTRSWWFTPGGGLDPGEEPRAAAARELLEETGHHLEPHALEGPVWERTAVFDFMSRPYIQHETFFVARLDSCTVLNSSALTESEEETIDEVTWLTHSELAVAAIEVFPARLREPWDEFSRWDGVTRNLGTVEE